MRGGPISTCGKLSRTQKNRLLDFRAISKAQQDGWFMDL
jgi:hypothetical protein